MTVGEALREAADRLEAIDGSGRIDAELLMGHALGVSRSELLLRHMGDTVPVGFAPLVARRLLHEPVAYILGEQEFFGLRLRVTPDVLIPRGDSEVMIEVALAKRPTARTVLDCGTGSGALLLAVLASLPCATGVGIDRSAAALQVAGTNADRLIGTRAVLLERDWTKYGWAEDLGRFDLILANPPYVETGARLAASVSDHEPAEALFAGADGLADYRVLVPQLPGLLAAEGMALVEIGAMQADAVAEIAQASGLAPTLHRDLGGRPRVLAMVRC